MALSTVFRRASSTVATLAFRAARSPVSFRSGAVSAERLILGSQIMRGSVSSFSFSRFSTESAITKTTADEKLVSVIESEIECAVEEEAPHDTSILEEKPEGFPFEIIDTPGERTVLLRRKFEDETIQVVVDSVASYDDEEDEAEPNDEGDDEDQESVGKIRVPMVVSVEKGDGVCLEFGVSAYPDEIVIDSLSIKQPQESENELAYEGPDFDDLDENLQKAFHRYLEIRGIKPSFTTFLADYVANKDSREYLQWLKDLKSFVEK
ncbi:unnamed protein product [Arabidopsis lyrata]|uniref:Mitochondrial glycoprotein family protein n=1 Tax=Arabidopsis lyrata subsp. lyrata TaxID=81972 RepID=D7M774_ARALL|nr:uncharacterized protein At2g39795, mitochondrial [Arabidopsis lyrata subsp. lyrata]EFH49294.1 mitochondrial glycoprotein family protein [Arabidopsis lyrata subsp. lyrata]CAH8269758.1 unnamed protein product [Arabidopsis lyrata]|eukprot:XP_020878474.1 uncharacterized protein At2g39795, mitochondrial [Arabidopsis lyrata subsp. lyrata]